MFYTLYRTAMRANSGNYYAITYGNNNGGTTIQLPFGFVQWHKGQMQFHHSYEKIRNLLNA